MSFSDYLKRLAIMILVVMPCTVLALPLVQLRDESARSEGIWSVLGGAAFLVYIWGIVTAILLSFAHTYIMHALGRESVAPSLMAGVLLGLIAGAATPTAFTGFLNHNTILWGGFTGLVYAAIVARLFSSAR
ncbi:MAG: hypothetical protein ACREON_08465 [Gemmatimonadaceae bacterium]